MRLFHTAIYEIAWYGPWWLLFAAATFVSTRYLGWLGFFVGAVAVSVGIVCLDVSWIFADMRNHPENGRDADFVFWFGVLCRIVLFNVVLLPVACLGLVLPRKTSGRLNNTRASG